MKSTNSQFQQVHIATIHTTQPPCENNDINDRSQQNVSSL